MKGVIKSISSGLLGILAMNLAMSVIFVTWLFVFPETMGQLVREPAKAAIADGRGPLYLFLVALGVIVYEVVCRFGIQRVAAFKSGKGRWLGITVCGLLATAVYARFGIAPAAFGFLVGSASAVLYTPDRKWMIGAWQLQWQYGQMAISLLIALLMHGECRANYLWAYKLRNIREGNLCHLTQWGWVDASHKHLDRFEMITKSLEQSQEESVRVTVSEPFVTITRDWLPVTQTYEVFNVAKLTDVERWAVASGISMDFSRRNEEAQGAVPFYLCSQLSSWQFDDMPSTLLTCLSQSPGNEIDTRGLTTDKGYLEAHWNAEGMRLVRQQFKETKLPVDANPKLNKLLDQIELAKEYWRPVPD